ncbi:AAA family ATPase [Helicobacter enhydrae]|uniref:AAA family ATPase n=1 Tax=Helicobacter enhydrae TaxID=222136 RepID=A0A1B1U6J8_9HELI|nr:ATP-binding protein [Helicobacter enhydrae]ANV98389.1 AAA family ATPase [Helicobacter enhydrae]
MQNFLDFIHSDSLQDSIVFPMLNCDIPSAKILQSMSKALLEGQTDFNTLNLIEALFSVKGEATLPYLNKIKHLLDQGWILYSNFSSHPITSLELLNETIYLSPNFLKLLEEGQPLMSLPEDRPYKDHLEYLKDQFLRIELLMQSKMLYPANLDPQSVSKSKHYLTLLNQQIQHRLKLTHKNLNIHSFLKKHQLQPKEEIIFFALLREEYYGGEGILREMNTLIELVSENEYEKIKNRSLLDDKSTLIEKGLIDYDEFLSPFGGISRTFFITQSTLHTMIHSSNKHKKTKHTLSHFIKEQEIFEILKPKKSLKDIILAPQTRSTLENLLKQMDPKILLQLKHWGIKDKKTGIESKIIFYGASGTGKTLTALALAKSLKKDILNFDCSKILSMYVGESEKNVRKIFDTYQEIAKKSKSEPILLLDEADQFLSTRSLGSSGGDKMHNQMQNIFLEQIERFDGILIATTNLLETIDLAFSRRFNYKIEFKRPTLEQRKQIWNMHLPKNADFSLPQEDLIDQLSTYDLSGGQIALVCKNTAYKVATRKKPIFNANDFIEEIQREKDGNFDREKSMGFFHNH